MTNTADNKTKAKRQNAKTTANKRVSNTVRVEVEDLEWSKKELERVKEELRALQPLVATFPTLRACYQEMMSFIDENPDFTLPSLLIPMMMTLEQVISGANPLAGILDRSAKSVFAVEERIADEWLQSQT